MDKKTENRITMFKTVMSYCNLNAAIIATNVGVNNLYTQYVTILNELLPIAQTQIKNRKGVTQKKKEVKDELAFAVEEASGIIMSHFDSVNNHAIYEEMNVPISKLRNMRDTKLSAHAKSVEDLLTAEQAALLIFGVDAAYIGAFTVKLDAYDIIISSPTIASNEKKEATSQLKIKVKAVMDFLTHELDKAMLAFKHTQPNFYNRYVNARNIIDAGIRHNDEPLGSIKGIIKDEVTNLIIPNAIIEIINTPTMVISNELGEFTIISIPPENYDIKVSAGNYENKTVENITVTAEVETTLEIKLTPAA